ncbi:MAG TPA: PLD nuclease N-terminal domain-containing protein [Blastocatellia bacterium]|jgi:hypothetical protein|nr:PLD nuclease N-terminal domain-containing protein [Blastocatellia bacterium]
MGSLGSTELLILIGFVFWAWVLIDCAINEPSGMDKIVWILVILLANLIGAAIYFLVRRPKRRAQSGV